MKMMLTKIYVAININSTNRNTKKKQSKLVKQLLDMEAKKVKFVVIHFVQSRVTKIQKEVKRKL